MALETDLRERVKAAVRHFWLTRSQQAARQGILSGERDAGERTAVTGGAQMDGFVNLIRDLLCGAGLPQTRVYCERSLEIPGWYRPEKQWDLLIVIEGRLLAAVEFKSQIGPSFGNNYNNRTEEALGSATDVWAAYREGAFAPSARPWLGYLMLLEQSTGSTVPVRAREPHFKVFQEFRDASYAQRYQILLTKMVRERLYDAACLMLTGRAQEQSGEYTEPSPELSFQNFLASLTAKVLAEVK
ncbi:MAG: restriction endonuclease [Acidobacteria bacterium]|nr:restriction endonuclease [Acidobacteriota bacterium]